LKEVSCGTFKKLAKDKEPGIAVDDTDEEKKF